MTSGNFPKTADIVIIGGGAVGTATAYYLSKSGIKNIVVLEKKYRRFRIYRSLRSRNARSVGE